MQAGRQGLPGSGLRRALQLAQPKFIPMQPHTLTRCPPPFLVPSSPPPFSASARPLAQLDDRGARRPHRTVPGQHLADGENLCGQVPQVSPFAVLAGRFAGRCPRLQGRGWGALARPNLVALQRAQCHVLNARVMPTLHLPNQHTPPSLLNCFLCRYAEYQATTSRFLPLPPSAPAAGAKKAKASARAAPEAGARTPRTPRSARKPAGAATPGAVTEDEAEPAVPAVAVEPAAAPATATKQRRGRGRAAAKPAAEQPAEEAAVEAAPAATKRRPARSPKKTARAMAAEEVAPAPTRTSSRLRSRAAAA